MAKSKKAKATNQTKTEDFCSLKIAQGNSEILVSGLQSFVLLQRDWFVENILKRAKVDGEEDEEDEENEDRPDEDNEDETEA